MSRQLSRVPGSEFYCFSEQNIKKKCSTILSIISVLWIRIIPDPGATFTTVWANLEIDKNIL